ncbi:nuclear transport factor 2 family protein [Tahibacter harae]|uniref:Nuclear transport factor 2 family protein n=1 Tax=Tahibacter harae TaxID=2963937 RepID=A0ABT1QLV9_9GAMM|nr:nuclear transport factor 2 family protein [Tahibacter harae]MCQ4163516.1 nuclear transport factor 2 family protein [Tahibacter harae]
MTNAADIMKLEREFWQSLVDGTPKKAAALLTDTAASVSMFGIHHFGPAEYITMAEEGPAKLTGFSFSQEKVLFPAADVAVATYEVAQTVEMNGQPQEMVCLDSTTWVRRDGRWLAAVHTETNKQDKQGQP